MMKVRALATGAGPRPRISGKSPGHRFRHGLAGQEQAMMSEGRCCGHSP